MGQQGVDPVDMPDRIDAVQWPTFLEIYQTTEAPRMTISYNFEVGRPDDLRSTSWTDVSGWGSYTAAEKLAVRAALNEIEKYINVTFVESDVEEAIDFTFLRASAGVSGGRGWFQYNTYPELEYDAFILFNTNRDMSQTNQMNLILHETGHGLSLKHPGNYDVNPLNAPPGPYLPAAEDNYKFTLMSYSDNPELPSDPQTLMLYDIAALQERWGVNMDYNSGDDSYGLRSDNALYVIWDGGGHDTLDVSAASGNMVLDLRQGRFSNVYGQDRIAIAYGALIENAASGAGDDTLNGNDEDNTLTGGEGSDILYGAGGIDLLRGNGGNDTIFGGDGQDVICGGAGDDSIDGGAGTDAAEFEFAFADATITLSDDNVMISAAGETDVLTNVEMFVFTDVTKVIGDFQPDAPVEITGTDVDETLDGGSGNDTLRGMGGDDVLNGGDGRDTLNGGDGDDVINGGATAADLRDTVFAGGGHDLVDGGYGNDLIYGMDGDDTLIGGFGSDTLQGQNGNDRLTGSALSDLLFGNDGDDFVNGGFGFDRINGGAGADSFYHLGIKNHGADWIQDFTDTDGDVLIFGQAGAVKDDFQVNFANNGSGDTTIDEAFVIYKPRGLQPGDNGIVWALVDGAGLTSLTVEVVGGGSFDLLM